MPIDYKKYDKDWKTVIRPAILERAENKCEQCGVENGKAIFRGKYQGVDVYQDGNANIYNAANSELIVEEGWDYDVQPSTGDENQKAIKVVLTISHTDHDISNNDYSNLKALCQRCHLRHDAAHHARTRSKNKKQIDLF